MGLGVWDWDLMSSGGVDCSVGLEVEFRVKLVLYHSSVPDQATVS